MLQTKAKKKILLLIQEITEDIQERQDLPLTFKNKLILKSRELMRLTLEDIIQKGQYKKHTRYNVRMEGSPAEK
jgi:hypothetical protein